MRIRPLRDGDQSAVEAIQAATLADPNPDLPALATAGPLEGLVAVDATDAVVGYLLAVVDDDRAYCPELAVAPPRQREGIGTALLTAALDGLRDRDVSTVRLTARATDDGARAFYERRGFGAVERVPDHYVDGVDGVVYERRLYTPGHE